MQIDAEDFERRCCLSVKGLENNPNAILKAMSGQKPRSVAEGELGMTYFEAAKTLVSCYLLYLCRIP